MLFPEVLNTRLVVKSIEAVVDEWFRLGLELGVAESKLNSIRYDHPKDVEACKIKMVQQWLKQSRLKRPYPLWCSLVEALNEIGLRKMSDKISKQYSTSKFILVICLLQYSYLN